LSTENKEADMLLEDLGNVIKTYRTRLGFTQNDLASALQVSPQAVSKWERGENAPDIAMLPALSELLGASVDTLLCSRWREKRTVEASVVFADMENFSDLAMALPPADLAIALNTWFYPVTEHMLARDGLPIKCIGDELLCVFVGERHRERAFMAIFEARTAVTAPTRFSIASGPVWMGPLGHPLHARPDVLGGTVNLASALQPWAKRRAPSLVAASAGAVDPVRSRLSLGFSESVPVPGSAEPATFHEVLGIS